MIKSTLAGAVALLCTAAALASTPLEGTIDKLSKEWAVAKFKTPEKEREAALAKLAGEAHAASQTYAGHAEPLVWEAIILASEAGAKGGMGALDLVKQARGLLEQAEKLDPDTLDGSVYTSLGSLYYQVPGWPIGFGDKEKAETYLKKALTKNPNGIDPNYFYGDFLLTRGDYPQAVKVLKHALEAPPRPGQEVADAGRREEIKAALAKAEEKEKGGFGF